MLSSSGISSSHLSLALTLIQWPTQHLEAQKFWDEVTAAQAFLALWPPNSSSACRRALMCSMEHSLESFSVVSFPFHIPSVCQGWLVYITALGPGHCHQALAYTMSWSLLTVLWSPGVGGGGVTPLKHQLYCAISLLKGHQFFQNRTLVHIIRISFVLALLGQLIPGPLLFLRVLKLSWFVTRLCGFSNDPGPLRCCTQPSLPCLWDLCLHV